jgi:hypothetical protein
LIIEYKGEHLVVRGGQGEFLLSDDQLRSKHLDKKGKFALEQATRAQKGSRVIDLLFL